MEKLSYNDIETLITNFQNLHKTMHVMMTQKNEDIEFSAEQTRLLFILQCHQNTNQNTLAHKLNITKATLSVRLQRLEKLGYIEKIQDEKDKRNFLLNITEKGNLFIADAVAFMKEKTILMFDGVTKEQLMVVNEVIDKIKMNIENIKGEKEC